MRALLLDPAPPLPPCSTPAPAPLSWVTGHHRVVAIDPHSGIQGVWGWVGQNPAPPTTPGSGDPPTGLEPLELPSDAELLALLGSPSVPGSLPHIGPGRWSREVQLASGERRVEQGLLLDEAPLVLIEDTPGVEGISPSYGPRRWALLLDPEIPAGTARRLLANANARARIRAQRGTPYPEEAFRLAATDHDPIQEAQNLLEQAPLGGDPEVEGASPSARSASVPILRGSPLTRVPELLRGTERVEYALAALETGRWGWPLAILSEPPAPGASEGEGDWLPELLLAARWCLWTGRPLPPALRETHLDRWVEQSCEAVVRASADGRVRGRVAFPSLPWVLGELADGLEGTGDRERARSLRDRADRLRLHLAPPAGSGGSRKALPVVGAPPPPASSPPANRTGPASLPPPGAFAPLDAPAVLPFQTLQAARLLRSWVEGVLGVTPDAAVGRLGLHLDLRGFALAGRVLQVQGLRMGQSRVSLEVDRVGELLQLHVRQDAGRVPLQFILQLRLGLTEVGGVRLGDEIVNVDLQPHADEIQLRCQFPLDSERRMTIEL